MRNFTYCILLLVLCYGSSASAQSLGVWPDRPAPVVPMVYIVPSYEPIVVQEVRYVPVVENKIVYPWPVVYQPLHTIWATNSYVIPYEHRCRWWDCVTKY